MKYTYNMASREVIQMLPVRQKNENFQTFTKKAQTVVL